jgi:hypothetical protein
MPVMTKPKVGDVRYLVSWIDRDAMRLIDPDDDLVERLQDAERTTAFATEAEAKTWAEANTGRDEYGAPRLERQTLEREYPDVPPSWSRGEYHEFADGSWVSVFE